MMLKIPEMLIVTFIRTNGQNYFHLNLNISPREDDFQVVVCCDRVEFADKEDILWWSNVGVGQVAHHLQNGGPGLGLLHNSPGLVQHYFIPTGSDGSVLFPWIRIKSRARSGSNKNNRTEKRSPN